MTVSKQALPPSQTGISLLIQRYAAALGCAPTDIEDALPLLSVQEGILFHSLTATQGDSALMQTLLGFASRADLDRFVELLDGLIQHHSALRTSVLVCEDAPPVQLVFRRAKLPIVDVQHDTADGSDGREWLRQTTHPSRIRLPLDQPPLLRAYRMHDAGRGQWLLSFLSHHLVSDYSSIELLLSQLSGLPPEPPAFGSASDWQAAINGVLALERTHSDALAPDYIGIKPSLVSAASAVPTPSSSAQLSLGFECYARLRQHARRQGVFPSSVFHLAWSRVLTVLSGHDQVVFGSVVTNRPLLGHRASTAIGPLVNTLPVVLDASQLSVAQGLAEMQVRLGRLFANGTASLARCKERAGVAAGQLLFDSVLNFRLLKPAASTAQAAVEVIHAEEPSHFPLAIDVDDLQGRDAVLSVQSSAQPSASWVAELLLATIQNLLDALDQDPHQALAAVDVLSSEARTQLAYWSEGPQLAVPADCLHRQFESVVARQPDATALVQGELTLSYAALERRANAVAHALRRAGVGPGERVALHLRPGSWRVAAAMLGTLKAGAAFVPLEPHLPAARLRQQLDHCAAAAVLSDEHDAPPALAEAGARWLGAAAFEPAAWRTATALAVAGLQASAAAYVVYTSGSTGVPKGVMVTHAAMAQRLAGWDERLSLRAAPPVVLQMAGLGVDICFGDLLKAVCRGGRLVLCPAATLLDPPALAALLSHSQATLGDFVPAVLRELTRELLSSGRRLPHLRHVLVGSEAWNGADLAQLRAVLAPTAHCYNVYGQTESVIDAACLALQDRVLDEGAVRRGVPMGAPLANTSLLLLDARGQPVPQGVLGELYIGGPGLALGYLGQPALTAARFLPAAAGVRCYRTGDMARWLGDGTLEFLGREDQQVKLHGFRVELSEVEAALAACEPVRQCAVLLHRSAREALPRLVAYVQADPAPQLAEQLRQALQARLPAHMVPSAIVVMAALPLLDSGKIDRQALPPPPAPSSLTHRPTRSALEQRLAAAWADVLELPSVGLDDNFFVLGGDSIRAVRLVARCRADGLHLTVPDVYLAQTLEALAARCAAPSDGTQKVERALDPGPFALLSSAERQLRDPARHEDGYPLTQLQQGIVFHEKRDGAYLVVESMRVRMPWSEPAFRRSLSRVQSRHEVLRTVFDGNRGGRPLQWVLQAAALPLEVADWRALTAADAQQRWESWSASAATRRFADEELLWRVQVHWLSDEEFRFTLVHHHAILDGWSVALLNQELLDQYAAALAGRAVLELPAVAPFRIYVAEELAREARLDGGEAWRGRLLDAVAPAWAQTPRGASVHVDLELSHWAHAVEAAARRLAVSPQAVLLAVHMRGLMVLGGTASATTCVTTHARPDLEGGDRMLGLFLNALPMCATPGKASWDAFILDIDRQRREGWQDRHCPLAQVQRVSPVPLDGALFTCTDFHVQRDSAEGEITPEPGAEITNFRLDCHWHHDRRHGRLSLTLASDDGLFDAKALASAGLRFERALRAALERFDEPVCADPLLGPEELARLAAWSETPAVHPHPALFLTRFDDWVRRQPQAVAVEDESQAWSYEVLDQAANRIAQALLRGGVRAQQPVAFCVERSVLQVAAALGVLKAGAAYVPLSPEAPVARLMQILDDARPLCVLVDEPHAARLADAPAPRWPLAPLLADATLPSTAPEVRIAPQQLAYLTYTSGSTGRPKGVLIEHQGLGVLADAHAAIYGPAEPGERWLQMASAGFDVFTGDLLRAVGHGGTLVMCPREVLLAPSRLLDWLAQRRITAGEFVPTVLRELCAWLRERPRELPALRRVIAGADRWFAEDHLLARQVLGPQVRLFNTYGVTEASIDSTVYEPVLLEGAAMVPIGRPFPGCSAWILDAALQPVPVGVTGELCLGGVGLARGYLNRPELDRERFVQDPRGEPGQRLYRSGDLARWREDGSIELIGRSDFQVKIRGQRVELGEIEAALLAVPGVREALVDAPDAGPGERHLAAWVVADTTWDAEQAARLLRQRLPEYMVPASFMRLERLPRNDNGKLDRRALPQPQPLAPQEDHVEPSTAQELLLARLWQELLAPGRPISALDNFFALGGHSLLAMRLSAGLDAEGARLPLASLFTATTLRELATHLVLPTPESL